MYFWRLKKMPGSAAAKTFVFSSQLDPQRIKTMWEPPVLWIFFSRTIYLHGIEPFFSQKYSSFGLPVKQIKQNNQKKGESYQFLIFLLKKYFK
jgi:hypothetical protein